MFITASYLCIFINKNFRTQLGFGFRQGLPHLIDQHTDNVLIYLPNDRDPALVLLTSHVGSVNELS